MPADRRPAAALRWMRAHKTSTASIAIAATAATVLSVMAFTYEGFTTTDVDLHDGGVWVTKTETRQLGRLNVQAEELDGGIAMQVGDFDVLQDDETVLVLNRSEGAVQVVDEVGMVLGSPVTAQSMDVAFDGGTVALIDPTTGDLYAYGVETLATFSSEAEPLAELGEGAVVTVAEDGSVVAASPSDATLTTWPSVDGLLGEPEVVERTDLDGASELSIAAIGDEVVVLDGGGSRLLLPDAVVDVPEGAVLQQSGEGADRVVLTTGESLIVQPMDGSNAATERFGTAGGEAVPAMQSGGCVFAVWPSTTTFTRDCAGVANDHTQQIPELTSGPMTFRERHGIVVLNQIADGNSWLVTDQVVLVDNWDALIPETSDETTEEDDDSLDDTIQNQPPPLSEENTDPIAGDDDIFGARAGRATVLPVLWNDTDPDGDVLTISVSEDSDLPSGVVVSPIANDSRLQVELPADYSGGGFTFGYEVDDGRGGTDDAVVTVSISTDGENEPPEQLLTTASFQVEQTRDVEYQVLQDWYDPDGDDLILADVVPDSEDAAQVSPGGTLRYTATGDTGLVEAVVTVSDGIDVGEGSISVEVTERGESTPVANTDFISTTPGTEVTIQPLLNDYVAGNDDARLAAVNADDSGLEIEYDDAEGTVTILDGPVGEHYLSYQLAVGPIPVTGRIRVDIREPEEAAPPVAVRDVGLLPEGRETLIDLLANDIDPSGGVLVVQSVDVRADADVTWQLLEHSILRITDNQLTEPLEITYTISNGQLTDTGTVMVLPVPTPAQPNSPVAVDDSWEVREGDFATIPVTDNDFSPDGLDFEVQSELVASSLDGEQDDDITPGSRVFVDGDRVRVYVPVGGPSSVSVTYEIVDAYGTPATATVTIDVVERDEDDNDPPLPEIVTARVLAGSDVRIPIPLDGIDPDGDGVELMQYDDAPSQGSIVEQGAGYFDFHADDDASGTVQFTYRVRDRMGGMATAIVVIGIAQPGETNQAPQAATDRIEVQPDRAIAFDVLQNDSDPDGDSIGVSAATSEDLEGVAPSEDGETVEFFSPTEPGDYFIEYTVQDARGASATGTLFVTVTPDAQPLPPRGVDDALLPADAAASDPVVIDVLDNDLDPDGDPSVLDIQVIEGDAEVVAGGVQVTPNEDDFQIVTYEVTDADGLSARAFLVVPRADARAPWLTDDHIEIPSGQRWEIDLADHVQTSNGNAARLTTEDAVSATWASDTDWVIDEGMLQYQSQQGYTGSAAITFEVTDGESAEDPDGRVSVLTIQITVLPSSEVPPEFNSPALQVGQGEDAPIFDLRTATEDPDPGDIDEMDYELIDDGSIPGVSGSIDDGLLSLTASLDAVPGDTGTMRVRITDPAGNEIEGSVAVEVLVSSLPLAEVSDHAADGVVGEPVQVPVLDGAFNPFASQGDDLTVVGATVLTGDGSEVSFDAQTVTVTPAESGQLQVRYVVQDATDTAQREVTGIITITVTDVPEQPGRPNVDGVGNGQVTLRWVAPFHNGAPIEQYLVESADGSVAQECPSTTCTIEGLQNGQEYQFTVTAINAVGESDPSPPSSSATPDTPPEQPAPPVAVRGDEELTVTWTPPANEGTEIASYTVEISPGGSGPLQQVVAGGTTSLVWTGLTNGTAYTFRVQAANNSPEPSAWSEYSEAVVPAGPPTQVQGVSASRAALGNQVQIQVSWDTAGDNGDPVQEYIVTPYYNGNAQTPIPVTAPATTMAFDGQVNASANAGSYTFTVQAVNGVGPGQPSGQTAPIRDVTTPGTPTAVAGTNGDGGSTITFTPGAANGASGGELVYQYRVEAGGAWGGAAAITNGQSIPLNNNGGPYRVQVRAVSVVDGQTYEGAWSNPSANIRPFGQFGAPTATAVVLPDEVRFDYTLPNRNGRALQATITLNGQSSQVNGNGSISCTRNRGQECNFSISVDDNEPSTAATSDNASARIANPSLTLTRGEQVTSPVNSNRAPTFVLDYSGLPVVEYVVQCFDADGYILNDPGRWTPHQSGSGTTPRDQYTFCISERGQPYRIELSYGGQVRYEASTQ